MDFTFSPQPQSTVGTSGQSYSYRGEAASGQTDMLKVLFTAVFVFSVVYSVGSFAYLKYLSGQVDGIKSVISSYDAELGALPVLDMQSLSDRIGFVDKEMKQHPYASTVFALLERSVEKGVTFLSFELSDQAEGGYTLTLTGSSPDYRSIVQQIDTLRSDTFKRFVPQVEIISLTPDKSGKIMFSLKAKANIKGVTPTQVDVLSRESEDALARARQEASSESRSTPIQNTPQTVKVINSQEAATTPNTTTPNPIQ